MNEIRLILDSPRSGEVNMALDQVLLEHANSTGESTLRLYKWDVPTLSLGYFQKLSDRLSHFSSQTCQVVRRASGGGAILHHHDLTYSLAIPAVNRWSRKHEQLYHAVHQALITCFNGFGIQLRTFQDSVGASPTEKKSQTTPPFLCFQRRTSGDLVCGEWKVGGSAQRRLDRSILQHGSLLLKGSNFAPELAGMEDLLDTSLLENSELACKIGMEITHQLELTSVPYEWSENDLNLARVWVNEKFGSEGWISRR